MNERQREREREREREKKRMSKVKVSCMISVNVPDNELASQYLFIDNEKRNNVARVFFGSNKAIFIKMTTVTLRKP